MPSLYTMAWYNLLVPAFGVLAHKGFVNLGLGQHQCGSVALRCSVGLGPHFCGCFNYRLIGSPTGGGRRYVIKYGSPGGWGGFLIANPGLDEGHKYCH